MIENSNNPHAPNADRYAQFQTPRVVPNMVPTAKPKKANRPNAEKILLSLIRRRIKAGRYIVKSLTSTGIFLKSCMIGFCSSPAPTSKTPCRIIYMLNIADMTENKTDTAKVF